MPTHEARVLDALTDGDQQAPPDEELRQQVWLNGFDVVAQAHGGQYNALVKDHETGRVYYATVS